MGVEGVRSIPYGNEIACNHFIVHNLRAALSKRCGWHLSVCPPDTHIHHNLIH
jgi:hypothetical protein